MQIIKENCYLCNKKIEKANDENEVKLNSARYFIGKCCWDSFCDIFNSLQGNLTVRSYYDIMKLINYQGLDGDHSGPKGPLGVEGIK